MTSLAAAQVLKHLFFVFFFCIDEYVTLPLIGLLAAVF